MKIAVLNIFKESFNNVWTHKLEWVRVATGPVVIWLVGLLFLMLALMAGGSLSMDFQAMLQGTQVDVQVGREVPLIETIGSIVYYVAYLVSVVSIMINGYRYAVYGEGGDSWWTLNLNMRFVKIILYYLLILLIFSVYGAIATGITIGVYYLTDVMALAIILGVIFGLAALYGAFRLGLTFLLVSIDQEKPLRLSWVLLEGNVLRFIGLVILVGISVALISGIGLAIIAGVTWLLTMITPLLAIIGVLLFMVYIAAMWLLSWAVGAKAVALVFDTFTEGKAF